MQPTIQQLLTRKTEQIIVRSHLKAALKSDKKLRVKFGIDPTGPKIHLGRAIPIWKLREFQKLGHKIVLIIGGFTAQIGDPSDKLTKRPFLSEKQVKENMKNYKKQLGVILDLEKVEFHNNSQWLSKLSSAELTRLAEIFSVQQMLARRNFKKKKKKSEEIEIREMLYPLFQGYDSVKVKADVEVGGFDQLFNLTAGRDIQKYYGQKPQDIITTKMLLGLDGRKMSTSWGNVVNISDSPNEMYGKIMSMHDEMIPNYFLLCTRLPLGKIEQLKKDLKAGTNPRDYKAKLAYEIVKLYHGDKKALAAQKEFEKIFKRKEKPSKIKSFKLKEKSYKLVDLLRKLNLVPSKSEARRLAKQGGVKINDKVVKEWDKEIEIKSGMIVQVGKRRFAKIK
jgi:tyrosyl-tRNA synthetase